MKPHAAAPQGDATAYGRRVGITAGTSFTSDRGNQPQEREILYAEPAQRALGAPAHLDHGREPRGCFRNAEKAIPRAPHCGETHQGEVWPPEVGQPEREARRVPGRA